MPTVQQLRSFVALCEHGTTTAAARATHCSVSTVSTHVHALESMMKTTLLVRTDGRFRPTARGLRVLAQAVRILEAHEGLARLRA
ncbi:LysR family transcriptional regulator [Promicromonospora sp. NPDC050880]|uniref:LysR family transcriptional regulator n=1 Tax=Promicromonospora sp. NPDC050880 TaxID=3364406 RepID=UPI00378B6D4B